MKYFENNVDGLSVFELEGKIMGGTECEDLCHRMMDVIATGQSNLVVDFEKVQWMNSAGMGWWYSASPDYEETAVIYTSWASMIELGIISE